MVYLEGIGVVFKYETYESNHSMVLVKIKKSIFRNVRWYRKPIY